MQTELDRRMRQRPQSRPIILVVDEDTRERDLAADFLRRAGYRVAAASCWDAALGTVREIPVVAAVAPVEEMTTEAAQLVREMKNVRPDLAIVARPRPLTRAVLLERISEALG
jgi:DNA-binding NtrC family response regulator